MEILRYDTLTGERSENKNTIGKSFYLATLGNSEMFCHRKLEHE
jgi:hypothetical protein